MDPLLHKTDLYFFLANATTPMIFLVYRFTFKTFIFHERNEVMV